MKVTCPNCKYEGEAKPTVKGSILIEIFLWLLFLLPGLFYSVWRLTTRALRCPNCGWEHVIKQA